MTPNSPPTPVLLERLPDFGLQPLRLLGRTLLPIVQGGMGVAVSASSLAGNVAALGAVGALRFQMWLLERG